jgi:hypothetical protein
LIVIPGSQGGLGQAKSRCVAVNQFLKTNEPDKPFRRDANFAPKSFFERVEIGREIADQPVHCDAASRPPDPNHCFTDKRIGDGFFPTRPEKLFEEVDPRGAIGFVETIGKVPNHDRIHKIVETLAGTGYFVKRYGN